MKKIILLNLFSFIICNLANAQQFGSKEDSLRVVHDDSIRIANLQNVYNLQRAKDSLDNPKLFNENKEKENKLIANKEKIRTEYKNQQLEKAKNKQKLVDDSLAIIKEKENLEKNIKVEKDKQIQLQNQKSQQEKDSIRLIEKMKTIEENNDLDKSKQSNKQEAKVETYKEDPETEKKNKLLKEKDRENYLQSLENKKIADRTEYEKQRLLHPNEQDILEMHNENVKLLKSIIGKEYTANFINGHPLDTPLTIEFITNNKTIIKFNRTRIIVDYNITNNTFIFSSDLYFRNETNRLNEDEITLSLQQTYYIQQLKNGTIELLDYNRNSIVEFLKSK